MRRIGSVHQSVLFPHQPTTGEAPRVVITGAGIITALGHDWSSNNDGFRTGRTGFRPVRRFDVSRQRVKFAAEIDLPGDIPRRLGTAREIRRMDVATRLLLAATDEAWQQTKWRPGTESPFVLGTTSGGMGMGEAYYRQAITDSKRQRQQASRVTQYQAQLQAMAVAKAVGFSGPITIIANACASGANALGHAWWLLRQGRAQRILAGGYDALSHLVFSGFDSLLALSPTQCRPFDARRDGLALGEGAAVVALETLEAAQQRGATILGEISGYGATTDPHHLTQPQPQGNAAFESMQLACAAAGIKPGDVGYVNAHGTGTLLNDHAEGHAINRWAGGNAADIAVSSTKAGIGHLLGAAGAVEAVICLMALRGQWLPPTPSLQTIDPLCQFKVVRQPTRAQFNWAVTNSFGFGGANASLVLRRWTGN